MIRVEIPCTMPITIHRSLEKHFVNHVVELRANFVVMVVAVAEAEVVAVVVAVAEAEVVAFEAVVTVAVAVVAVEVVVVVVVVVEVEVVVISIHNLVRTCLNIGMVTVLNAGIGVT